MHQENRKDNSGERSSSSSHIEEYFGYYLVQDAQAFILEPNVRSSLQEYYDYLTEEDSERICSYIAQSGCSTFIIQPDIPLWLQSGNPISSALEAATMNKAPVLTHVKGKGYCLVSEHDGFFSVAQKLRNHESAVHEQLNGKRYNLSHLHASSKERDVLAHHYDVTSEFFWQLQVELDVEQFRLFLPATSHTIESLAPQLLQEARDYGYPVAQRIGDELVIVKSDQTVDGIVAAFQLDRETRILQLEEHSTQLMEDFQELDVSQEQEVLAWLARFQELHPHDIDVPMIIAKFAEEGLHPDIPEGFYNRVWNPRDGSLIPYLDSKSRDDVVALIVSVSLQEILDEGFPLSAVGLINYLKERDR